MASERTLYGIAAVLVAALLISASVGLYFYFEYTQAESTNGVYLGELNRIQASYNATAARYNELVSSYQGLQRSYNGSFADLARMVSIYNATVSEFNSLSSSYSLLSSTYNRTLSLLASSVAVLNTTEPAYINASRALSSLWRDYATLAARYRSEVALFDSSFSAFTSVIHDYQALSSSKVNLLQPVAPVRTSLITSNILIDFGNDTYRWYNGTSVQPGWNLYVATLVVTNGDVQAQWYPSFGPHGEHYIVGIDGVSNTKDDYWFLWTYNATAHWQTAVIGADELPMYNGSVYGWTFCAAPPPAYNPTCTPR